jgi:hypothetical protein
MSSRPSGPPGTLAAAEAQMGKDDGEEEEEKMGGEARAHGEVHKNNTMFRRGLEAALG